MFDWENEIDQTQLESLFNESKAVEPEAVQQQQIDDFDDVMSEAERRYEIAQYYKLLLRGSLFQNKTEASSIVEKEIREFIRERFSVLIGIKSEKTISSDFNESQINVLKEFADLGQKAPKVLAALTKRLDKKIDSKAKPEPTLNTVKESPAPALKKNEEPKLSQPQPQQKPKQQKPNQNPKGIKVPKMYQDDPTLKIENGRIYIHAKNALGEYVYERDTNTGETRPLMRDVTPIKTPENIKRAPMPTDAMLSGIMQSQAQKVLTKDTSKADQSILNQLGVI